MWKFRFFELPDDHGFIYSARGLVDGYFKVLSWLLITATFQIIAETSHSALAWALCVLAYLMIFFYLQAFVNWLAHMRWRGSGRAIRNFDPGQNSKHGLVRRLSAATVAATGTLLWLGIVFGVQASIDRTVTAIVEVQRAKAK
uniref:Uncharacterized protein n=2 Tax=Bradyrhizobium amphicarpaeae TaxID=1404768 RepID=A0A2U8PU02_9BRAD|nr:hypothetical protein CIT40_15410 [Bradyrhizobium amphicarpaeae]